MGVEDRIIFLNGLLKKIVVKTIDTRTHTLDIHFKHSYVNDGFEWKFMGKKLKKKPPASKPASKVDEAKVLEQIKARHIVS